MKILVLSDSHRSLGAMYDIISLEQPHQVIHLGDHISDAREIGFAFDKLPFACVPGNCDYAPDAPDSLLLEFGGKRLFLTHGHRYGVKMGLEHLKLEAKKRGADAALFGHTHVRHCEYSDSLWLLNPGAAGSGCYGLVTIENNKLTCEVKRME